MWQLERLTEEYIYRIVAEYNRPEILHLISDKQAITVEEVCSFVWDTLGMWFAVCDGAKLFGICGLHQTGGAIPEISITLFPESQRKGIGSCVYRRLFLLAREFFGADSVEARILRSNQGSVLFHEKLGFEYVSSQGDWLVYARNVADAGLPSDHKLSVIIPTYNSENTIGRTLESLRTFPEDMLEIIVVDDNSSDGTVEIVKKYGGVILIKNRNNMLPGFSRNIGMSVAEGEYIYFLDSDDEAIAYWLYRAFILAAVTQSDVIYTNKYLDQNDSCIKYMPYCYSGMVSTDETKRLLRNQFIVWTAIYKKEFLGHNNVRFYVGKTYEDNYFSFYVALGAARISYFDKIIVRHYVRQSSLSKSTEHLYDNISVATEMYRNLKETDVYKRYREEIDLWFYYFDYVQTLRFVLRNGRTDMLESARQRLFLIESDFLKNKYIMQHSAAQRCGIEKGMSSAEAHVGYIKNNVEAML